MYPTIKLYVKHSIISNCLIIHTDNPLHHELKITNEFMVASPRSASSADSAIQYALRRYIQELCFTYGYQPEYFDISNVSGYLQSAAFYATASVFPPSPFSYQYSSSYDDFIDSIGKDEPPFEVNMMECLVGWKGWKIPEDGLLHSPSYEAVWQPDQPFQAICSNGSCKDSVVRDRHTCGIYATDKREGAKAYGVVKGLIYGWGRYVRGDAGWRSQFAYPKSFHLTSDQIELIEPLKKYHVDIFIDQPIRMYDPQEEGYGYRETDQNGHCGAAADSGTEEEGSGSAGAGGDEED